MSAHITDDNADDIKKIQSEIGILRENLTKKSKKWVAQKLSAIWARIARQGTQFIKDFLSESKKELIKQSIRGVIGYIKENGADLLN